MKPLVSAIVPSWNRCDELRRCLASLLAQDYPAIEVIVVDDAGTDDSMAMVRREFPSVTLIEDTVRCGHFFRRNQGIVASAGTFLLHLDSDVVFQEAGIVSRMVARMEADPGIGELGGEIAVHAGHPERAVGLCVTAGGYTRQVYAYRDGSTERACDVLPTLNVMTCRAAVLEVGGFDPWYEFGMGDTDFGLGFLQLGLRNVLDYTCSVHHHASPSGRRPDKIYRYCLGRLRMMLKRRGVARTALQALWDALLLARLAALRAAGRALTDMQADGLAHLPRAYAWHARHWRETRCAARTDFLAPAELERFHAWKRAEAAARTGA